MPTFEVKITGWSERLKAIKAIITGKRLKFDFPTETLTDAFERALSESKDEK